MQLSPKAIRNRTTLQRLKNRIEYEKRYFRFHRRRIAMDNLGNCVFDKIEKHFAEDHKNLPQVLWCYHTANKIFIKTLELGKYQWQTKERRWHMRQIQILKGFLLKDLLLWEKPFR